MKKYLNISKKVRVGLAVLVGILVLFLIFRPKPRMNDSLDEVEVTDSVEVKEIVCKYGIPVDHYDTDKNEIVNKLDKDSVEDVKMLQVWYTRRPLRYQLWNCSAEPEPFLYIRRSWLVFGGYS